MAHHMGKHDVRHIVPPPFSLRLGAPTGAPAGSNGLEVKATPPPVLPAASHLPDGCSPSSAEWPIPHLVVWRSLRLAEDPKLGADGPSSFLRLPDAGASEEEIEVNQDARLRALMLFLMAAAVVSFGLCVFSDVRMSTTHVSLSGELALALAWLTGHGLHGAVVVLLPVAYFLFGQTRNLTPIESDAQPDLV